MEPTRLLALATELENEGQYYSAKTLRAAAEALLMRESTTVVVPTSPTDQAAELDAIAQRLDGSAAAVLSEPLRSSAEALRNGAVPMDRDTPDPRVCRICGETRLVGFAGRCPHCGRWPGAEQRHRPIYWLRASTPPEAVDLLARTPGVVQELLAHGQADVPGPDGGWTATQTLEHLHNAQSVFRGRIDQLLAGGEPELASVRVWKMDSDAVTVDGLLDAYLSLRAEILDVLRAAPPIAWWHTGSHEEFGVVSLAEQTSYFANHEPTHLAQLADAAHP